MTFRRAGAFRRATIASRRVGALGRSSTPNSSVTTAGGSGSRDHTGRSAAVFRSLSKPERLIAAVEPAGNPVEVRGTNVSQPGAWHASCPRCPVLLHLPRDPSRLLMMSQVLPVAELPLPRNRGWNQCRGPAVRGGACRRRLQQGAVRGRGGAPVRSRAGRLRSATIASTTPVAGVPLEEPERSGVAARLDTSAAGVVPLATRPCQRGWPGSNPAPLRAPCPAGQRDRSAGFRRGLRSSGTPLERAEGSGRDEQRR